MFILHYPLRSLPVSAILLCLGVPFLIFYFFLEQILLMWKEACNTFLSEFGLFNLTRLSPGILTFLQMTWIHS